MQLGVSGLNAKAALSPAVTARLAGLVEDLGYTSWWAGDHVVLPSPRTPDTPMDPRDPILDPLVHLTYVAALTRRVELGTGIVILPQRNPLVLAKQAASLDVLSGGQLVGTPDELAANLTRLKRVADEVERPARLGRLEITAMQIEPVDPATADRFAELGVDRLLVYPLPLEDPDDIARFLERHAGLAR